MKTFGEYIHEKPNDIALICGTGPSLNVLGDLDCSKSETYLLNGAIIYPYKPPESYNYRHGTWKWKPKNYVCIDKDIVKGCYCARSGQLFKYRADGSCPHCKRVGTCLPNYEFEYWLIAKYSGADVVVAPWLAVEREAPMIYITNMNHPANNRVSLERNFNGEILNGPTVLVPTLHMAFLRGAKYIFLSGCDLSKQKVIGTEKVSRRFWDEKKFREQFPWLNRVGVIKKKRDLKSRGRKDDQDIPIKHFRNYQDLKSGIYKKETVVINKMYRNQLVDVSRMIRWIEDHGVGVYKISDIKNGIYGGALDIPHVDIGKFKQIAL